MDHRLFLMNAMDFRFILLCHQQKLMDKVMNYVVNLIYRQLSLFDLFFPCHILLPKFVDELLHGCPNILHSIGTSKNLLILIQIRFHSDNLVFLFIFSFFKTSFFLINVFLDILCSCCLLRRTNCIAFSKKLLLHINSLAFLNKPRFTTIGLIICTLRCNGIDGFLFLVPFMASHIKGCVQVRDALMLIYIDAFLRTHLGIFAHGLLLDQYMWFVLFLLSLHFIFSYFLLLPIEQFLAHCLILLKNTTAFFFNFQQCLPQYFLSFQY